MASIPSATLHLSYPLYACDFDPQDANRLVLGGGGGPGRSGVSNKISAVDASHQDTLNVVSELDLSRDEDSVNTIAVGPRRRNSILVFTGINSSPADVAKGKNEHFRVFAVDQPSKSKTTPKIAETSRTTLFSSKDADTYQRVLRLSPYFPGRPQVGAIATGLAKDAQIAVFDVPPGTSGSTAPRPRGVIEVAKEAMDLDLIQTADDKWQLVYCDDYEIYTMDISKGVSETPRLIFTLPHDDYPRPTFRSIRFLTPTFILCAANLPKAGGVVLHGFRLPKPEQGPEGKARLAISAKLVKTVTRATGMAVRNLTLPTSPSQKYGDSQFAIAVSGQDSSITLYALEHQSLGDISLLAKLQPITTLKAVHAGPISGLAFSHFAAPKVATMRVLHLKLASIGSMGNTCVVHSLPLRKLPDKTPAAARRAAPPRVPRYVLALKSHGPSANALIVVLAMIVVLLGVVGQGFLEVKGITRPILGAKLITPAGWHETHWRNAPAVPVGGNQEWEQEQLFLAEYLGREEGLGKGEKVVLNVVEGEGDAEVTVGKHGGEQHADAREWHELPAAEKAAWKEKLKKAGHWGEEMGETILKSVLFGQIAGVVGGIVREL
ncbi:hypothetical protein B0T25DRAFT_539098 [Lasiosphaeria hispida]|uniref:Guanine nucleotide-exchange factor SEC12 n=1 Tax=Lasiosphaeria hispida TaxID=260671 RepID=A0AAJ0MG48_9PEZI|nr:hypothetical protein B0T25DRAFT_539098 [Lasiosphaeria hispida]